MVTTQGHPLDSEFHFRARHVLFARFLATTLIVLGVLVLAGWMFDVELLKSVLPGKIAMKPMEALGFIAAGAAIILILGRSSQQRRLLGMSLSALVISIGSLTLLEYLFGINVGIDKLVFRDYAQTPFPGRMAHITAMSFCVAGMALLSYALSERQAWLPQILAAAIGLNALLAIVGYTYGVPLLHGSLQFPSMAAHTAIGFLVLSAAIACCRPDRGPMEFFTSSHHGGWLARRLLPAALVAPILIGAIFLRLRYFFGDDRLVVAAVVTTHIIFFGALIATLAYLLNQVTRREASIREDLLQSEKMLRQSQKLEAIGLLAGGVAHDFNNLLMIIGGHAEIMIGKIGAQHPLAAGVQEIRSAADRASSLTRQLLAFGRRQVLQPVVLNLNTIVVHLEKMLARLIGEDIELTTVLSPALSLLKADAAQLEQIIINLVINARDAMPNGGKITIETQDIYLDEEYARSHTTAKAGHHVMLIITDTGNGMDEGTQAHIFEPFFTTKAHGTGLGLATVYGIVKQSGGWIWVYSEIGYGTTFKVYFPQTTENPSPAIVLPLESVPQQTCTILLVEDSSPLRAVVREYLQRSGFNVLEAIDTNHAMAIAESQQEPIHLLLTDVVMPGMNGPQLADQLTVRFPSLRVLFMSGYMEDAIVRHGLLNADVALISKPFTREQLVSRIAEVLRKNGLNQTAN